MDLKIEHLTEQEANAILQGLLELPAKNSFELIKKIQLQFTIQIDSKAVTPKEETKLQKEEKKK